MQTRFAIAVFVTGLLQCVVLTLIALSPAPENASGLVHGTVPGMRIGGDGLARLAPIRELGFFFQILVLLQCHLLIAMGVSHHKHDKAFMGWLTLCLAIALFVWWSLFSAYTKFLETGETTYFIAFPVATAWQVYAIWLGGLSLVALYVFGFRRFIWSSDDERAFQALVDASKKGPDN